ncbi:putative mitochondrial protein, partial [Mucuna pruriens]
MQILTSVLFARNNSKGVEVDEKNVRTIKEWPTPKTLSEVRSFHWLASFYRRFVKNFSTLAAPLIEIVKKSVGFKWEEDNTSGIDIGAIFMQESHLIDYFSEKLSGATLNYPTYDKYEIPINLETLSLAKRKGKENVVVHALSRRHVLLSTLNVKLLRFEYVKKLYVIDPDFEHIYVSCEKGVHNEFYTHDGFLFKGNKLCCLKVLCMNYLLERLMGEH